MKGWVLATAALIVFMDLLWVVTTPLKLGTYTPPGRWLFGLITLAVAIIAAAQTYALVGTLRYREQEKLGNT